MAIDQAPSTSPLPDAAGHYELSIQRDDRRAGTPPLGPAVATPAFRRDAVYRHAVAAGDVVALMASALIVVSIDRLRPESLALVALIVLVAKMQRLYDRDPQLLRRSTLDEAPGLFNVATFVTFVLWTGAGTFVTGGLDIERALLMWGMLTLALVLFRTAARSFARTVTPVERCLVLAEADEHRRLAEKLECDPRLKARVVAHLPLVERRAESAEPPHAALDRCVRQLGIHRVIVAPDGAEPGMVLDVVSRARMLDVNVSVLPRICEVVGSSVEFDDLGGLTLLGVRPFKLSRSSQFIKRSVDLVGAAVLLTFGAPFLALIALAIKLDSRGPVLFRQTRVGRDGATFELLKFRSMVAGADETREELLADSPGGGLFKLARDPRVTRVGRLLRRRSLDELPQLVNVLRGDMSLVGPRPLIVEEDAMVVGHHRRRLHLKPGLTGPWQVLGSPDVRVGVEDMATIDYLYSVNWSLWQDVQVIIRTIAHVIAGRGV